MLLIKPNHLLGNFKDEAYLLFNTIMSKLQIQIDNYDENKVYKFLPYKNGGKVFIIDGNLISDWGTQNQKYEDIIIDLIDDFSRFNASVVSFEQENTNMVIPLNSSIYIEATLKFWGDKETDVVVNIDVDSSIEPESPTVINFNRLTFGSSRTVGFWFIPRSVGKFNDAIKFTVKGRFHQTATIGLDVFSGYKNTISKSSISREVLLNQFNKIKKKSTYNVSRELDKLIDVLDIDPRAAIMKARFIMEQISKKLCIYHNINVHGLNFSKLCEIIADKGFLSKKGIGYLNTIRIIGNLAAHAENEGDNDFGMEDGFIIGQALVEVLDELIYKEVI